MKKLFQIFLGATMIFLFPAVALAQWQVQSLNRFGLPRSSIMGIVINVMMWIMALVGMVAVIGFAISGILYMTAAGNENQMDTAKRAMTYSIIGVVVALSSFVILWTAFRLMSGGFSGFFFNLF